MILESEVAIRKGQMHGSIMSIHESNTPLSLCLLVPDRKRGVIFLLVSTGPREPCHVKLMDQIINGETWQDNKSQQNFALEQAYYKP
jgi:hypothetical protein